MSLRNVEKAAKRLQNVEDAIRRVRDYIHSYQPPGPGSIGNLKASVANSEMSTRYTVIDPVLRSLGWDLSDPSQCVVEKIAGQKRGRDPYPRVDYALLGRDGMVAALVEAKRISVSVRADPLDTSPEWCKAYANRKDPHCQFRGYLQYLGRSRVGFLTNGAGWQLFLPRDGRWEPHGNSVQLGSRTVKRNAQRLIDHLDRDEYW